MGELIGNIIGAILTGFLEVATVFWNDNIRRTPQPPSDASGDNHDN